MERGSGLPTQWWRCLCCFYILGKQPKAAQGVSKQPNSPLSYKNVKNNTTRTRCYLTAPGTAGCSAHKSEWSTWPHARPRSTFCRGFAPGQIFALRGAASCFVVFKDSTTSQHASRLHFNFQRSPVQQVPISHCSFVVKCGISSDF